MTHYSDSTWDSVRHCVALQQEPVKSAQKYLELTCTVTVTLSLLRFPTSFIFLLHFNT
jgi:hypothetical protein